MRALKVFATYHQDTIRPPVGRWIMTFAIHNLRCHVLYRPTERKCLVFHEYRLFTESKVGQFDVSISIQQNTAQTQQHCTYRHMHVHTQTIYSTVWIRLFRMSLCYSTTDKWCTLLLQCLLLTFATCFFFTQKQVFGPHTAKSQPIWIKLYTIHLWADLDHNRRVGGSRPNQNDYVLL